MKNEHIKIKVLNINKVLNKKVIKMKNEHIKILISNEFIFICSFFILITDILI